MGLAKTAINFLLSTILFCVILVWNLKQFLPNQKPLPPHPALALSAVLPDQAGRYHHSHHRQCHHHRHHLMMIHHHRECHHHNHDSNYNDVLFKGLLLCETMRIFGTFRYLSYLGHFWTIWAILDHFGPFLNKSRKMDCPPPV